MTSNICASIEPQYNQALHYINRLDQIVQDLKNGNNDAIYKVIAEGGYFYKAETSVKQYADAYFRMYGESEPVLMNQMLQSENKLIHTLINDMKQCDQNNQKALILVCKIINQQSNTHCINTWKERLTGILTNQYSIMRSANKILTPAENELIDKFMTIKNSPVIDNREIVATFLKRGGKLTFVEEGDKVNLTQSHRFVVGCTAANNRSQLLYKILNDNKCNLVLPPIGGGCSGMNPTADFCYVSQPAQKDIDSFQEALGYVRIEPLGGAEFGVGSHLCVLGDATEEVKAFYQNKFNELLEANSPLKILAFHVMVESTIIRLVQTGKMLNNVEVMFFNISDYIDNPKNPNEPPTSPKGVLDYYNLLKNIVNVNK